jgi:hypothetical protein
LGRANRSAPRSCSPRVLRAQAIRYLDTDLCSGCALGRCSPGSLEAAQLRDVVASALRLGTELDSSCPSSMRHAPQSHPDACSSDGVIGGDAAAERLAALTSRHVRRATGHGLLAAWTRRHDRRSVLPRRMERPARRMLPIRSEVLMLGDRRTRKVALATGSGS